MIILAYVICGTLAALAATIMTAKQGYGNVKIGMNLLMPCFTAVYIGMSVFKRPCVIGTFLGRAAGDLHRNRVYLHQYSLITGPIW